MRPHTGEDGVALGRRVNGEPTTNALDLHLNLAAETQVELSFCSNYSRRDEHLDGIWFSDNGGDTFIKVSTLIRQMDGRFYGQLPPLVSTNWRPTKGSYSPINLSYDFSSMVVSLSIVHLQMAFFIDDVEVRVRPPATRHHRLRIALKSANCPLTGGGAMSYLAAAGTARLAGVAEVTSADGVPRTGSFVRLGRLVTGEPTTNALDLLLDLSNHEQVQISFWGLIIWMVPIPGRHLVE